MKRILNKVFYPSIYIAVPFCFFSALLLIYVFSVHLEESMLSYFAYLFSTYSLIIFVIWFIRVCKFSSKEIKETKIYMIYNKNIDIVIKYTILVSLIFNFSFGSFELITGIVYKSWWFITFAVYYLILCFMKFTLISKTKQFGKNLKLEYKKLMRMGIILFVLNIILTGMIVLIIKHGKYFSYPGYLIYGIALYDFYLIITAIVNVVKYKNNKSPVVIASKCISLTVAMISMLSLEVAMIYKFGSNDTYFKLIMVSITGLAIVSINSIMAIIMIIKACKKKPIISD